MIIVKTMAGLGNQLFQYACARALALRHGSEVGIWREPQAEQESGVAAEAPPRPFRLPEFAAPWRYASADDLARMQFTAYENPFTFFPALLEAPDDIALQGFWQSEQYFEDARATLRRELEFRDPARMELARSFVQGLRQSAQTPVVAVHVRRGDYVEPRNAGLFHSLSVGWYQQAMARYPAHVQFLFFSDDLDWCRAHFEGARVHFAPEGDDLTDLARLRACDGYIIANSSFSWWGAWLSDNPDAAVIAPSTAQWFGPRLLASGQYDATHIVPARWLQQPDLG